MWQAGHFCLLIDIVCFFVGFHKLAEKLCSAHFTTQLFDLLKLCNLNICNKPLVCLCVVFSFYS